MDLKIIYEDLNLVFKLLLRITFVILILLYSGIEHHFQGFNLKS